MEFDLKQLQELLATFNQSNVAELNLKSGEFELTLRKNVSGSAPVLITPTPTPQPVATPPLMLEPAATPSPSSTEPALPPSNKKWVDIISPMVGTFYRSPAPDEPPFVDVGDTVRKNQTVCILEAMKLMNDIEAEVNGQIMEILVQNGEPVEYGQVLMRVNPS